MMMPSSSYLCIATIFVFSALLWCFPAECCVPHDSEMLLAFKHNVLLHNGVSGEDVHGFLRTWKNGTDCCKSWERVVCNPSTSHVQQLNFQGLLYLNVSSARMALHPLSKLRGLTSLDLSLNRLDPSVVLSSLSKFSAIDQILLQYNTGVGSISLDEWSLESLKRIRYLDLKYSGISGRLPSQISNMSNLLYLDLSSNSFTFTSEVMETSLPSMSSLQYLGLSKMNLSMTTQPLWHNSIANLSDLSTLALMECSLTEANVGQRMNWLGKLHNLEELFLGRNSIRAMFPLSLSNLTKLTRLDMSYNMFMGEIPHSLGLHLHNLHILLLGSNQLNGTIPNSLGNMSSLLYLDMGNNSFITRFPEWISGLQNLIDFRLYSAQLIGSISSSFNLPSKLQVFEVSSNKMTGTISDTFFRDATKLGWIDMSNSGLTINVSSTWIPPLDASVVLFRSCNIGGNFPQWTSFLDLIVLDLSSNGIVGNLPSWFWDGAMKLQQLYIHDNDLEGSMSICGSGNGSLRALDASHNKFTSAQFGECLNLVLLNLENNSLQGKLPSHFGEGMPRLGFLSLENNQFVGALPNSLGKCTSLHILNLANNSFEGKFPRWIFNLHNLKILKMSSNNFMGDIPNEIGMMSKLQFLDLSFNQFKGVVPQGLWNLPTLQYKMLDLVNESISFSDIQKTFSSYDLSFIPPYKNGILNFYSKGVRLEYLVILKGLTCIDLSHNNLIGRIPINVGRKVKGLRQLNLSHNSFTGTIPNSISEMDEIESLDLSYNHFFGKIPQGFGGLSTLEVLDLSYNNLSGIIPRAGQMQTFDSSRFEGNVNLTDPQYSNRKEDSEHLETCCEKDDNSMKKYNIDELLWGLSVGLAFGVGFAGFTLAVIFNKDIKTKTFKFMDHVIQVWILKY